MSISIDKWNYKSNKLFGLLTTASLIILATACGGGGSGGSQSPDPVALDLPIAYVKRPIPLNNTVPIQPDASEVLTFNAGADLYIRARANSSAPAVNITLPQTEGMGDVKDVEASYDGTTLVFAMREPERATDLVEPTWNIWAYHIVRKELKRVITDDIIAEEGDDIAPHFLPDGRIIFSSTRQIISKVIRTDEGPTNNTNKSAYTALEESRNEAAAVLHIIDVKCVGPGSDFDNCGVNSSSEVRQISFNQSHDIDASVLSSGHIIFTRWDHAGNRNAMHLYRANPDGTETKLVYGRQSHDTGSGGSTIQFLQPREMSDGRLVSLIKPFTGTFGGGDIVAIDIGNYTDNTRPILPNQLTPITNGQSSLIGNNVITTNALSPGGRYSSAYPLWDGTNRLMVSWTPCRILDIDTVVACTADRLANPASVEALPLYGLFIFNPADKTQLPIFLPEEGIIYTDLVVAQDRTRPAAIADKVPGLPLSAPELNVNLANANTGILHIRSVYDIDGVFNNLGMEATSLATLNGLATTDPDGLASLGMSLDNRLVAYLADTARFTSDLRPARFLRIVKSVGIPDELNGVEFDIDNDAFGVSAQQGMREIIGYAPIEPDGSVMVEVPANVPLAISVLDINGRRLSQRHQSWIQVKPGETVTCSGCHNASPNTVTPVDGIHGHAVEPEGANFGAPQNGYIYPGTNTNPLIVGDSIATQNTGQTMAQARLGNNCAKTTCKPNFDIIFDDIWTNGTEASFMYEFRQLLADEPLPLSTICYDSTSSLNKWKYDCRAVINYPETIQTIWGAVRAEDVVCDPTLTINDPRCEPFINPPTPPAVPYVFPLTVNVDSTCVSCHTAANNRLDLTNTANGNFFLSYTDLFAGRTVQQQTRDAVTCALNTNSIPDPNDPTGMTFINVPDIQAFTIPAQFTTNGARASAFFERFDVVIPPAVDIPCQTVNHKNMLSVHEKKFLSEWLDIGAQYYNDPTNANVPVN